MWILPAAEPHSDHLRRRPDAEQVRVEVEPGGSRAGRALKFRRARAWRDCRGRGGAIRMVPLKHGDNDRMLAGPPNGACVLA